MTKNDVIHLSPTFYLLINCTIHIAVLLPPPLTSHTKTTNEDDKEKLAVFAEAFNIREE